MQRTYDYKTYIIDVSVQADFQAVARRGAASPGYVAVVRIYKRGAAVATFSPLRFGDMAGKPFATDVDALMGGYSAARRLVDDLFSGDSFTPYVQAQPIVAVPVEMLGRFLIDWTASGMRDAILGAGDPQFGLHSQYSVPLAFLEAYPWWKQYVTG